jgi:hypothetical protein
VALLEKRGFLYNHSGDFPQVILIVPSHVPNNWCDTFKVQFKSYFFEREKHEIFLFSVSKKFYFKKFSWHIS